MYCSPRTNRKKSKEKEKRGKERVNEGRESVRESVCERERAYASGYKLSYPPVSFTADGAVCGCGCGCATATAMGRREEGKRRRNGSNEKTSSIGFVVVGDDYR